MIEPAAPVPWTPAWVRDAVFYQIFPDRFATSTRVPKPGPMEPWDAPPTPTGFKGGDLLGVVEHLDYLVELGINAIYFNPIFSSASNHRYHTYDYMRVDPLLGGDAALRELIDTCHARGIRVVLDGVFNHASRGFWPFHHVMEVGGASPYREWFYLNEEYLEAGRQLRAFEETARVILDTAEVPEDRRLGLNSLRELGYRAWWDLPALPKLNTDNPHVREYLLSVAEHWIRFGIDGWRLDVAEEIPDQFWREFRERVKALDPEAYIVAEIWDEKPQYLMGDMYDALMNYPFMDAVASFVGASRLDRRVLSQHFALNEAIRPEDGPTFASRIAHLLEIYPPEVTAVQLNLLDSHDTPRFLSIVGGDVSSLRLATLIQMTMPGAPCIYYGGEIGMIGEQDPGSRAAFPWAHPDGWDHDLLAYMREVIALRRGNAALRDGAVRFVDAAGEAVAYLRSAGDDAFVVVVNAGTGEACLKLGLPELEGRVLVPLRLAGWTDARADAIPVADGRAEVVVHAREGVVLRAELP
jgi:neopullulanase